MSKINRTCRLIFEKSINFGLINAKNVSMHKKIQTNVSARINLKFLKLFIIQKQHSIYINII